MRAALITLTTAGILWAVPAQAAPPCCHESVHVYEYGPRVYRLPPLRWSVGAHLVGVSTNQELGGEGVALGGIGGHIRYRDYRWGAEATFDVMGNSFLDHSIQRVSIPLQLSALLYIIPRGTFNLYLLGGLQMVFTHVQWDLPDLMTDQTFTQFGMHGGVGAELNLTRQFALTADLRAFGLMRNDNSEDGSYYKDVEVPERAIVPNKTVGLQLNLGVSLRF